VGYMSCPRNAEKGEKKETQKHWGEGRGESKKKKKTNRNAGGERETQRDGSKISGSGKGQGLWKISKRVTFRGRVKGVSRIKGGSVLGGSGRPK